MEVGIHAVHMRYEALAWYDPRLARNTGNGMSDDTSTAEKPVDNGERTVPA